MHFAERFIRRPVLSSMVSLGFVLVGVISYTRLPAREFPDADPPIVSVSVTLAGGEPAGHRVRRHGRPRGRALEPRGAPRDDQRELSDIADRQIKPRLQTIRGVSGAPIYGDRRFAMRVWPSPRELAVAAAVTDYRKRID